MSLCAVGRKRITAYLEQFIEHTNVKFFARLFTVQMGQSKYSSCKEGCVTKLIESNVNMILFIADSKKGNLVFFIFCHTGEKDVGQTTELTDNRHRHSTTHT